MPPMIKPRHGELSLPTPMPMMVAGQAGGGLMNALMKMLGRAKPPVAIPAPDPAAVAGARDPMFTAVGDEAMRAFNAARQPQAVTDPMEGIYKLIMSRFGGSGF